MRLSNSQRFAVLLLSLWSAAAVAQTIGPPTATGGSSAPSGPAGGDLSGTYPNPNVSTYDGGSTFGTAASANTGTSGATLGLLSGNLTFSGANAYGTPTSINLANGTALPLTGLNGLGTGVATALGNPAGGSGGFALQSTLSSYCALSGGAACTFTGVPITTAGSATTPGIGIGVAGTGLYSVGTTGFGITVNSTRRLDYGDTTAAVITASAPLTSTGNLTGTNVVLGSGNILSWTSRGALSSPAGGQIQLGAADAAAPVAQSLFVQNVVAGTSNIAGTNTTMQGSLSTGSGVSGDIVLKTGGTGAAATVQNAANTAIIIKGATQQVQLFNSLQLASISACTTPTGANGNFCVIRGSSGAGFCTFEVVTTTNTQIIAANVPGGC